MDNYYIFNQHRDKLLQSIIHKPLKELKQLRQEWEALYNMAKEYGNKPSMHLYRKRCSIIDEAIAARQKKRNTS